LEVAGFAELGVDPPSKAVAMQEHEVIRQQVLDSLSAWLTANDEIDRSILPL